MRLLYRLSLQLRIWLAFVLITTLAISAIGLSAYRIAAGVAEQNAYRLSQDLLNKTSQALDEKLNKIKISVFSMMINPDYRRAIGLDPSPEFRNYYTHLSALQSVFVQLKLIEPLIKSIVVATPDGPYYEMSRIGVPRESFYNTPLYDRVKSVQDKHIELWVGRQEDPFYNEKSDMVTFLTEGAMNEASKGMYVVTNVEVEALRAYINRYLDWNEGRFLLLSREGEVIVPSETKEFANFNQHDRIQIALQGEEGYFDYQSDNQDYFVNYRRLGSVHDWVLFSILPKSSMLHQLDNIKWAIIAIILVCLLLSVLFARMLARLLLKPLNRLQTLMKRVELNDLSVRFDSAFQDEITQVGYRFNRMLEEINQLFQQVKESEREKRKAELNAMQAQINPHFLYNTLNTIYWKSQLQEHKHVQQMVLALSQLFRLGLNKGRELTTLNNEIVHVTQYLNIQKQCYTSLFDFQINVSSDVDPQQPILKILLQPIVENSILHGFKNRADGGFIRIDVRLEIRTLLIEIEDNGEGFSAANKAEEDLSGYALYNVRKRLSLEYGGNADLLVESHPGQYTKVTISIPVHPS